MNIIEVLSRYLACRYGSGRMVTVFPDDVFLVSYPKSGNTWARFLIGSICHAGGSVDFSNIEKKVPDIYKNSNSQLLKIERPRILKSHEYLDPRYKKVIYIVRDPRDVVISYYHHAIKFRIISEDYPLGDFVARFMRGEIDAFGTWYENVTSWLDTRVANENFQMLRYEDLLANTHEVLQKVAEFLGLVIDTDALNAAVDKCSLENMQKLEKQQSDMWSSTRKTRKDKQFVRAGRVGGWKNELPPAAADHIKQQWGRLMSELGYE